MTSEDLKQTYESFKVDEDILLWCDGKSKEVTGSDEVRKRRRELEKSSEQEDVDAVYKEKHSLCLSIGCGLE